MRRSLPILMTLVVLGVACSSGDDASRESDDASRESDDASRESDDASRATDDASRDESLSQLAAADSAVVHEVQLEAILSAAHQASGGEAVADELAEQRANTDEGIEDLESVLGTFDTGSEGESFRDAVEVARTRLDDLGVVRAAVDGNQMSVRNATNQLTETSGALLDLNQEIALAAQTTELSYALDNYVELSRSKQQSALSAAILAGALQRPAPEDPGEFGMFADNNGEICTEATQECTELVALNDAVEEEEEHRQRFFERATPDQRALVRNVDGDPALQSIWVTIDNAQTAGSRNLPLSTIQESLDAEAWMEVSAARLEALLGGENAVLADIVD